jgi:ABC-type multidrug transport system ATPase subunit
MKAAMLAADSIGKRFGDRRVLTSARLEAMAGELTVIAGKNGSGKSTLMKICAGVERADYGSVQFPGSRIGRARLHDNARRGLFFLPDRMIFLQSHTVRNQLQAMSYRYNGLGVEEVGETLGIASALDQWPHELSGGELRRCEVALGVIRQPLCYIADEPLRGIDPKDRDFILDAFRMCADLGSAVLLSGHETGELLDQADSVVWVHAGSTSHLGSGIDARRNDRFCRDYLTGQWV